MTGQHSSSSNNSNEMQQTTAATDGALVGHGVDSSVGIWIS